MTFNATRYWALQKNSVQYLGHYESCQLFSYNSSLIKSQGGTVYSFIWLKPVLTFCNSCFLHVVHVVSLLTLTWLGSFLSPGGTTPQSTCRSFWYTWLSVTLLLPKQLRQPSALPPFGTTADSTPLLALSSHHFHSKLKTFLFEVWTILSSLVLFAPTFFGSLAPWLS